jgi:hypothetical protein
MAASEMLLKSREEIILSCLGPSEKQQAVYRFRFAIGSAS